MSVNGKSVMFIEVSHRIIEEYQLLEQYEEIEATVKTRSRRRAADTVVLKISGYNATDIPKKTEI